MKWLGLVKDLKKIFDDIFKIKEKNEL